VAVGSGALGANAACTTNVAVGFAALNVNVGNSNVAIGTSALLANTTGANNVAIGYLAMNTNTTGTDNVVVGYNAGVPPGRSNCIVLGKNAGMKITADGQIAIGSASLTGAVINPGGVSAATFATIPLGAANIANTKWFNVWIADIEYYIPLWPAV